MLRSSGAPDVAAYLERSWVLHPAMPFLGGRPHYVAADAEARTLPMHMLWLWGRWHILDVDGGLLGGTPLLLYARGTSEALHPNTIHRGEWEVRTHVAPCAADDVWERMPAFEVRARLEGSTYERPLSLLDIGVDFFVRCKPRPPIWFVDPTTGRPTHSACTAPDGSSGRLFCSLCWKSTLAKNFASQHMRKVHPSASVCPEARSA